MRRLAFNPRFVNEAGNDLMPGKIHTIRQNYEFWKRFEGKEIALFTWEGKPYRSRQKVFCTKRIVSVQEVYLYDFYGSRYFLRFQHPTDDNQIFDDHCMAANDGFEDLFEFQVWFNRKDYPPGKMAIIHFTDFRY